MVDRDGRFGNSAITQHNAEVQEELEDHKRATNEWYDDGGEHARAHVQKYGSGWGSGSNDVPFGVVSVLTASLSSFSGGFDLSNAKITMLSANPNVQGGATVSLPSMRYFSSRTKEQLEAGEHFTLGYENLLTNGGAPGSVGGFFEDWKLALKYTYGNMEFFGKSHYNRNQFNLSLSPDKVVSDPSFYRHGAATNRYHLPGQKYTSDNSMFGNNEYVILNGKHVTDPAIMGTYNYGQNAVSHFFFDMLLYYPLGNSINDPTTMGQRIFK